MSRTKKGVKNVTVTMMFYIVSMLLAFFSRKIFIDHLGEDLVGLSTIIINLLGFLNLAEIGVTAAISTALFKPLYDNDRAAISDIISIFNYLYYIIGGVVFVAGVILLFFLPYIFKSSEGVNDLEVLITYIALFISMLVTYFVSYKQLLLTADQKDYVITTWTKVSQFMKVICQIIALTVFDAGYISWIVIEFIFGVVYGFWINTRVAKTYPWLTHSFTEGRRVLSNYKYIFSKIKQIIPHRISSFVLGQTSNIIILAVTSSLAVVTSYNNYIILIGSIVMIFTVSSNGLYAGVGNLVAEGNKPAISKLFNELSALYFFLGGVICICVPLLAEPFIILWLGKEFVISSTICYLILFNTAVHMFRQPIEMFLNGYILYKDTWAPITQAVINLGLSIVLGLKYGLIGVVFGTSASLVVIVCIWRPIFLFREGFKISIYPYLLEVLKYILTMACAYVITLYVADSSLMLVNNNFFNFFINAFVLLVVSCATYGGLLYLVSKGMRDLVLRVRLLILSKFRA